MTSIPPGWYPDPAAPESGNLRWWSGEAWTEHVQAPPTLPPVQQLTQPVEPAYVPFSSDNTYQYADRAPARKRGPISRRFAIVAALLVVVLGVGAYFGIPAIVGGTGPLATEFQRLQPTPTPVAIPIGPDLGATTPPPSTAATTAPADLHPVASNVAAIEANDIAVAKSSMPQCDPLTYGAPVTNADTSASDILQILQPYANNSTAMSAIARQLPTVQAASEQTQILTALLAECSGYTNASGTVSITDVARSDLAPTAQMEWITTDKTATKTLRVDTTQVRYNNRVARVICLTASETTAADQACDFERAEVSRLLVAAANATPPN